MKGFNDTPLPTGPGSLARQWFRVLRATVNRPVNVVILGNKLFGLSLHYDANGGGTLPCLGDRDCKLCQMFHRRWKGYVAARYAHSLQCCVLEVTEACARAMGDNPSASNGLRGLLANLYRKGKAPNSPVHCKLERYGNTDKLPPAFDVVPHLERLYGLWVSKCQRVQEVSAWCPHIVDGQQIPVFGQNEGMGAWLGGSEGVA